MKKNFIVILVAIAAISCKKDPTPILTMGDGSGLLITEHNIKLETDTSMDVFSKTATLDLDQDDNTELSFTIYESLSPYYVGDAPFYAVEFYASNSDDENRQLILPEIPTSADWYVKTETVYDAIGTYPRKTLQEVFTCEQVSGSTLGSPLGSYDPGAVEIYTAGEEIFSLPETASDNNSYSLWSMDFQYEYWEFNETADSLIGYRKIKPAQCDGLAPFNQLFYIPFKIVYDDSNLIDRTGWIEMRLSGNNTLEILRSAISSN